MSFLGRTPSNAPLTSQDIPAGIIEGTDIGFLSATATENITGTLPGNSCNLSNAFVMTGDITISGGVALAKVSDDGATTPFLTNDGTTRTISGTGVLTLGVLV